MTTAEIVILAAKLSIVGMVFALGLRSKPEDIAELLGRPGLLFRSFVAINLVMPAFAITACALLPLRLEIEIMLIALSLSPVPPLLPGKVSSARGDRSFAIALLVVFAVLAVVWVPLAVHLVGEIYGRPVGVDPRRIAWIVATLVLVPLALGMAVRRFARDFAKRIEHAVSLLSTGVLVIVALLIIASTARAMLEQIGDGVLVLMTAFVLVGLAAGHLLGGPVPQERTDLALAAASRHPGITLAVAQMIFPGGHAATALVAIYLIVAVVIGLPYIKWRAKQARTKGPEA
jgi:bile acid:Na+ symporter, BASS family